MSVSCCLVGRPTFAIPMASFSVLPLCCAPGLLGGSQPGASPWFCLSLFRSCSCIGQSHRCSASRTHFLALQNGYTPGQSCPARLCAHSIRTGSRDLARQCRRWLRACGRSHRSRCRPNVSGITERSGGILVCAKFLCNRLLCHAFAPVRCFF